MANTTFRRASVAALAGAALVAGAAGCSTPSAPHEGHQPPPPAASTAQHNGQDVMFAQMMIPHHQQAIMMSEHELAVGADPAVKDLAGKIKQAQGPEIQTMQGWLGVWQAPAMPGGTPGGMPPGGMMGHEGHGGQQMQGHGGGMMTPQQMGEFQQARGQQADHLFLQMMIQHHQGAVDMARSQQQQGQAPEAKQLATSIVDSQQAEIAQMQHMLGH